MVLSCANRIILNRCEATASFCLKVRSIPTVPRVHPPSASSTATTSVNDEICARSAGRGPPFMCLLLSSPVCNPLVYCNVLQCPLASYWPPITSEPWQRAYPLGTFGKDACNGSTDASKHVSTLYSCTNAIPLVPCAKSFRHVTLSHG